MQIQMGVNQKMKLYNVYRLCKKHINFFKNIKVTEKEELYPEGMKNVKIYTINNWLELKEELNIINKVPALTNYVNDLIQSVPDSLRANASPCMFIDRYNNFISKKNILHKKMETIIELYESMNIPEGNVGIDIKLPPCEDLKDYILYLKKIDFIFSQCPFLQCENEILKFDSVDVGSNWLRLTIAATSTCLVLSQTASVLDKALALRSHYINIQQQEELLKTMEVKTELAENQVAFFKLLQDAAMNKYIAELETEFGKLEPEERDKAERSLEELLILIDKGCEIYATLDSPEEVQLLFPEIQSNLELSDDIIKYWEDKGEVTD